MPAPAYKRCTKCGEVKPLDEFHRKSRATDGRRSECKVCACAARRAWREANLEKAEMATLRWREQNPERHREAARLRDQRYRERHPGREAERHLRRRAENPGREWGYTKRHDERHPEKATARRVVRAALRSGFLAKPDQCKDCGKFIDNPYHLHAHHPDYSKPLEVEWLCRNCHNERHRAE